MLKLRQRIEDGQTAPGHNEELAAELTRAQEELAAAALRERGLLAKVAQIQEERDALRAELRIPTARRPGTPLAMPALLSANVLSRDTADRLRQMAMIAVGNQDEIDPAAYVLDGGQPLLDQGSSTGIEAGQNVYCARNVIGRIDAVGRWTSSVRLITDPEYHSLARLGRLTDDGMIWGAAGRLEGDGETHCVLRSIDATQSVSEGDLVFTAAGDGALPDPMLYGRVIKAELRSGAVEWEIRIEPAADLRALRNVHVLRQTLNPLRTMAN